MKQIGKVTKKWLKVRKEFIKLHPANHEGYWMCGICGRWVTDIEVDHKIPRSNRPDLRYDFDNLMIVCSPCNYRKGSKH